LLSDFFDICVQPYQRTRPSKASESQLKRCRGLLSHRLKYVQYARWG
jgi:hypothetical protein